MANSISSTRRNQVVLGPLPDDFLRIPDNKNVVINGVQQAPIVQQQYIPVQSKKLKISVIQATLVKNYGLTKMDPYARIRYGHGIYESHTSINSGKNPHWNKDFYFAQQPGVDSIYVEIYDECSFTPDERIAWAHISIPQSVYEGNIIDEWVPLNGKQGDHKEGSIHIILSFAHYASTLMYNMPYPLAYQPYAYQTYMAPMTGNPYLPNATYITTIPNVNVIPQPYPQPYSQPYPQPAIQPVMQSINPNTPAQPPGPPVHHPVAPYIASESDINSLKEMFPATEKGVISCILEQCQGNKDAAINHLLSM